MEYKPVLNYLSKIYNGRIIDTKPKSKRKSMFENISIWFKPKSSKLEEGFAELKKSVEDEKIKLGDNLLEDFMIADLPENPNINEVKQHTFDFLQNLGYRIYGQIGRDKLLINSDRDYIAAKINVGNKYLSISIRRVIRN